MILRANVTTNVTDLRRPTTSNPDSVNREADFGHGRRTRTKTEERVVEGEGEEEEDEDEVKQAVEHAVERAVVTVKMPPRDN